MPDKRLIEALTLSMATIERLTAGRPAARAGVEGTLDVIKGAITGAVEDAVTLATSKTKYVYLRDGDTDDLAIEMSKFLRENENFRIVSVAPLGVNGSYIIAAVRRDWA